MAMGSFRPKADVALCSWSEQGPRLPRSDISVTQFVFGVPAVVTDAIYEGFLGAGDEFSQLQCSTPHRVLQQRALVADASSRHDK